MAALFGVTPAHITARLFGDNFDTDDWPSHIQQFSEAASARLAVVLKSRGFEILEVEALGAADNFYLLCRTYIIDYVVSDVAASSVQANPEVSKRATEKRVDTENLIKSHAASLVSDPIPGEIGGLFFAGSTAPTLPSAGRRLRSQLASDLMGEW